MRRRPPECPGPDVGRAGGHSLWLRLHREAGTGRGPHVCYLSGLSPRHKAAGPPSALSERSPARPLGRGTGEDYTKHKAWCPSLLKAVPQTRAVVTFMGSQTTAARCRSPGPAGPAAPSPCPHPPPAFPSTRRHNRRPIQLNEAPPPISWRLSYVLLYGLSQSPRRPWTAVHVSSRGKKKKDCVHSSRTFWKNKSSLEATEVARLSLTVRPLRLQTSPAVSCCLRGLCPPASCCCPYLPAARQPWGNCIRLRPGFLTRKTERTGRSLGAARWGVAGRGAGRAREGARCRWRRSRGEGAPWLSAPALTATACGSGARRPRPTHAAAAVTIAFGASRRRHEDF